jgi:co-chaperonin GroES (HSP10)
MIHPVGYRVLVKPEEVEKAKDIGNGKMIYFADQSIDLARAGVDKGVVVEIGPCAYMDQRLGGFPWIKVGDKVIWARYAGKPVDVGPSDNYVTYHILNDEDILGKED